MTTREQISVWFDEGLAQGATHMIVACDTFDHDDYPVYCTSNKATLERYKSLDNVNMQKVMEVYDLKADKAAQMQEHRAFHLPLTHNAVGQFIPLDDGTEESETSAPTP